jgi:acetyl esterase/lipase
MKGQEIDGAVIRQVRHSDLSYKISVIRWLCIVPAALLTVLLILPAPFYLLWIIAVGASELNLWIFLIGLFGAVCGIASYKLGQRGSLNLFGIALAFFVIFVTGRVSLQAYQVAAQERTQLSWTEYLSGAGCGLTPVTESRNLVYAKVDGTELKLDVYEPAARTESRPAIVVIHGGSWRLGRKSDFPKWDRWLAATGYVVFDIEYRLANRTAPFPAQLTDVRKAIEWVQDHATEYKVDKTRIALIGRSAGAQLALLAAYTPISSDRNISKSPIRCVVSFYGPTDMTWDYYHPAYPDVIGSQAVLRNYLAGTPDTVAQNYLAASPVVQITANSPASLFLQGGSDQIVRAENMAFMVTKLQAAHVPVECLYLPWANHGFDWNFNGWSSQISRYKIASFFKKYL